MFFWSPRGNYYYKNYISIYTHNPHPISFAFSPWAQALGTHTHQRRKLAEAATIKQWLKYMLFSSKMVNIMYSVLWAECVVATLSHAHIHKPTGAYKIAMQWQHTWQMKMPFGVGTEYFVCCYRLVFDFGDPDTFLLNFHRYSRPCPTGPTPNSRTHWYSRPFPPGRPNPTLKTTATTRIKHIQTLEPEGMNTAATCTTAAPQSGEFWVMNNEYRVDYLDS